MRGRDRGQQRPDVGLVVDLEHPGRDGGRGAGQLRPGERLDLLAAGFGQEDAGQHLRSQAPVGPDQGHDRVPDLARRQVSPAGARPEERQRLDALGEPRRYRGGELAPLGGPEQPEAAGARRIGDGQRHRHLGVERQVRRVPVRQPAAGLVVANDGEPLGQAPDEGGRRRTGPAAGADGSPSLRRTAAAGRCPASSRRYGPPVSRSTGSSGSSQPSDQGVTGRGRGLPSTTTSMRSSKNAIRSRTPVASCRGSS